VKLAPVLVTGAADDRQRVGVLEDAIALGRELGAVIVGDGCATDDDLRLLLAVGCDRVQGPIIAEPMAGNDFKAFAASWDPDRLEVGDRG
jgi:EAL domain-containing protein (putative c-di-GMP-specific phosphodiesterase class I)